MKLSVSNIAWSDEHNEEMFDFLTENGFSGVEIAPTKIVPAPAYEHIQDAVKFAVMLRKKYGLAIPSMQSIWYGRKESLFGSSEERESLLAYTKSAVDFAAAINCGNMVFGCPSNRKREGRDEKTVLDFFKAVGLYSEKNKTIFAIEANPEIYGADYINKTCEAAELVRKIDCDGVKINLDFGTIRHNDEQISEIPVELVSHVHISEPYLAPIQKSIDHEKLAQKLSDSGYNGFVSVEMKDCGDIGVLKEALKYVKDVFA